MILFYDKDPDGICACHVFKKYGNLKDNSNPVYLPGDRGKPFPHEKIHKGEIVIFTDYCASKEDIKKILEKTKEVYLIDHHISTIEDLKGLGLKGLQDINFSSCELMFKFCRPKEELPPYIKILGDFDCWRDNRIEGYQLALALQTYDLSPDSPIWNIAENKLDTLLTIGKTIYNFTQKEFKEKLDKVFPLEFEGLKFLAINHNDRGAWCFEQHPDKNKKDALLSFHHDGKEWSISVYSVKDSVDVSKIAKKYGGGGHIKAAGFRCKKLPFSLP